MIRLLLSSLRFYRKTHLGILCGAALAAAVLTGSLLVGDSVDGTLHRYALQRLGNIHYAMQVPHRFVSESLATRLSSDAAAMLQLRGMALSPAGQQINQVQVIGCDRSFWRFCDLSFELAEGEVALSRKLAEALQAGPGDEVSLRIEHPGLLPMDAPLSAQNQDRSVRGRYTVTRIVGDDELGRFGLSASQIAPFNAFVDLHGLQARTEQQGKINLIAVGGTDPSPALSSIGQPEDLGLHFVRHGFWVQLESDGIYLDAETERAAQSVPGAVGTLTYLVNSISKEERATPYSFVLAIDRDDLGDDEMRINRWLADHLQAQVGDSVIMRYFELLPSGTFEERSRSFRVTGIAEMEDLETELALAPPFPGLTDVDRCADWDVGLPLEDAALQDEANEAYWNAYRQTPKAIVSLAAGQAMWSNRYGALTTVRWPDNTNVEASFITAYRPEQSGFRFLPVRAQAMESVEKAMDFGQLFVGMSFFLIIAALLLTAMIFVFSIQERAEEMGILMSVGWRAGTIRRLQISEGGLVALLGSLLGGWLGTGYTRLLIYGLAHAWGGAVAHTGIHYYAKPQTILLGIVVSFLCAVLSMILAAWRQVRHPVRELLQAEFAEEFHPSTGAAGKPSVLRAGVVAAILALLSIGLILYSLFTEGRNLALLFFAAAALLLIAAMAGISILLSHMSGETGQWSLAGLARRNAGRRRSRSLTVIALMAAGCFLVFAVSSMQENVAAHADQPDSGTGGFAWFGQSTLPIKNGLDGVNLRVRDGDDASCLNLNRARLPTLLGVDPSTLSSRGAFSGDIWDRLDLSLPDGMIPGLVGDTDTAMWGLEAVAGIEKGDVLDYVDDHGRTFKVKLVGALPMRLSVFQGTIMIAEQDFVERYPSASGYRMFLLDQRPDVRPYERLGLDVVPSVDRLREFYGVESTYLSMFLVLGALGLVVGSLGMGVVVLRNVQDRRSEIALLRAVGYRTATIRRLLFAEHSLLLLAGLGVGVICAFFAMVPAFFITRTHVSLAAMELLLILIVISSAACMMLAVWTALKGDTLRGLRSE